jgi:hypothetical protein
MHLLDKSELIITRLKRMISTPNMSFHYKEDCVAVEEAVELIIQLVRELENRSPDSEK